jgi:hypothetical protein
MVGKRVVRFLDKRIKSLGLGMWTDDSEARQYFEIYLQYISFWVMITGLSDLDPSVAVYLLQIFGRKHVYSPEGTAETSRFPLLYVFVESTICIIFFLQVR